LRGWVENDKPQTTIVWRNYLPVRAEEGQEVSGKEIEAFFNAAPLHLSEKLETETCRAADWLEKRVSEAIKVDKHTAANVIAFVLKQDGSLRQSFRGSDLLKTDDKKGEKRRKDALKAVLAGSTLVVDRHLAGLTEDGLLDKDAGDEIRTADDGGLWPADVGFKIVDASEDESADVTSRVTGTFAMRMSPEGEVLARLLIKTARTEDSRAASIHPQLLSEHEAWTADCASRIADAVGLTGNHKLVLVIAARLHDEGKRAPRWQLAFNAPDDKHYAKTKGPLIQARLGGYRHEFGSLPSAAQDSEFQSLPKDLQDLVLHLIAAHHGRARPVIGIEGCDDAPPSVLEVRARDVALRFARLQKQWGPWGLAWWEALLRAADQQASRDNDKRGESDG
jgi:CRISPR-associated endonuclease/helicase Cas3